METSAELRAKRAGFLARFDIGLKISQDERNEPELRYHHYQTKESFRLDRIEKVRHWVSEPFEENSCKSSREDYRLFLISSKIYPKVAHRAQFSSEELMEEAKKGI